MARTVIATCCGICGEPLKISDGGAARHLKRVEALRVEIGFSRGGWGRRDFGDDAKIDFSEEVCGDCYDGAQALLRPVVEYLRGGGRSAVDNVQPVQNDEPSPGGRSQSVLRALSFLRR
jgi:hypothetical protein